MLPDPLDIIWRCANDPDSVLTDEDLRQLASACLEKLTELGLLRQAATATHTTCDACAEQHVEKVFQLSYSNGRIKFFISCPKNGRVEVPRQRLLQWSVDYGPLIKAVALALSTSSEPKEVMSDRVWNLGRAALAGKSKIIWVARGLAWPDAPRLREVLPQGRSPVLFFMGQPPDNGLLNIPPESVIELRTVVRVGRAIFVDREAIDRQLSTSDPEPVKKKRTKRHGPRATTIGSLKRELHQYILSMKSRIRQADDAEKVFDLPRLTQKQLANTIDATETSVSRAFREGNDRELVIMFQTANNVELVRKYSR